MEELTPEEKVFIAWAVGLATQHLHMETDLATASEIIRKLRGN